MKTLTIGRVAEQASVGVETVRFYEREGLLEEPPRRQSGYREYGEDAVTRLRFIRRAKQLGFTLKEIKELLALRRDPSTPGADVKPARRSQDCRHRGESQSPSEDEEGPGKVDHRVQRTWHAAPECPLLGTLGQVDEESANLFQPGLPDREYVT